MLLQFGRARVFAVTTPAAALIAGTIATSAVLGWLLDISLLKSVLPGAVEMKLNAALGMLAAAIALLHLSVAPSGRGALPRTNVQAIGLLVAALGLLTVAEYVSGWNLGIDEALVADNAGRFNAARGRMSPYTATALLCIGTALFSLRRGWPDFVVRAPAVCTLCIGAISAIGYGWNASELTTDAVLPPVALNTAIALICLGAGCLAASRQPIAQASRPRIHRARVSSVEARVLFGFSGAFLFLLIAGGLSYKAADAFANSARSVSHTQQVRAALNHLETGIVRAGLSQRNYLITGQSVYLESHSASMTGLRDEMQRLRELVRDNPVQVANLAELEPLMARMQSVLTQTISLYDARGFAPTKGAVERGSGMQAMGEVSSLLARMQNIEDQLLGVRESETSSFRRKMLAAMLASVTVAAFLFAILFKSIRAQIQARELANEELAFAEVMADSARRDADAANRAKSRFLAAMSHEIRTPMNGVLGLLELLSLGELNSEQRSTLGVVRKSAASLLRIVDDILDFSKIEAGKLQLHPESASVGRLIERVCRVYAGSASSKGLALTSEVEDSVGRAHSFDEQRLEQVLNNFVSNAIKFTERGFIELNVRALDSSSTDQQLCFVVRDSGIGIAADKLPLLFQPFTQAEADTSSRYGGTGLGLTISRHIAEIMGGTATISSEVGVGTTAMLTVRLPLADASALADVRRQFENEAKVIVQGRRQAPSVEDAVAEGTLLLVVDDHPTNRLVLKRQVNLLGYAAETAVDGAQAYEMFCTGRYGAVITDCNMPKMSGYDLARRIRASEARAGARRIPVLACTANALQSEAAICLEAGMDDCLVKPAQLEALASRLDQWLPMPATPPHPDEGVPRPAPAPDSGVMDAGFLDKITGGQAAEQADLLEEFSRHSRNDAEQLRKSLFEDGAPDQARHFAHRVRGASGVLRADSLSAACESIEDAARAGNMEQAKACFPAFQAELRRVDAYVADRCRALRRRP